jgi:Na+-driven multidrug efflux pump
MGVAGVALATGIAQMVSAVLVCAYLCRAKGSYRLNLRKIRVHGALLKRTLHIGLPAGLQSVMYTLSNMTITAAINGFGTLTVAAWVAMGKVDAIFWMVNGAFGVSITTFVGQNIGQNQVKRAEQGANRALLISIVSTAVLAAPIMIFSGTFVRFFNSNDEIISYGATFIRMLIPFYLMWCVNQIYSGALRGVGKSTGPMIIMLASFVLFRQTYLFVVANYISNTIFLIAMGFPAGWVLSAIITLIYYKITGLRPKDKKQEKENDAGEVPA